MSNSASGPPSKDEFFDLVLAEIKRIGTTEEWKPDEREFMLTCGAGRIFLSNCYAEYCQAKGEHRKRILSNLVADLPITLQKEFSLDEAMESCVAVVRERALFAFTALKAQIQGLGNGDDTATEPISDWLCRALVIDLPGSMRLIRRTDLQRWGVTFEEMFAVGLERLRASTPPKFTEQGGIFAGQWLDDYDSSRMLLPGLLQELPLDGDPVLVIPNRLALMVTGSNNHAAIRTMLQTAEEMVRKRARPINFAPLTYREGRLQDFRPAPDSPICNLVGRANKFTSAMYYGEQTNLLKELHEKTGKDLFVAPYTLTQKKDGGFGSYATWTEGVQALLPKAAMVCFVDLSRREKERMAAIAPWEKAEAVVGHLMLDTLMFPPQYYVSQFPNEEQLKELGGTPRR